MRYQLSRGAMRAGIELFGRPVRLLGSERVPEAAAILVVCRAPRLLEALTLLAAFERPVHWVVPDDILRGVSRTLAWGTGILSYQSEGAGWHAALRACSEVLGNRGILAVFEHPAPANVQQQDSGKALSIAREAWGSVFPEQPPLVLPVHGFWPEERGAERLFHIGDPLDLDYDSQEAPREGADAAPVAACPDNFFALDPDAFERLLREVESELQDRLREEWEGRPGWKQKADGFRLSAIAAEQLRRINQGRPEDLAALKRHFDSFRELSRQWSLAGLRADVGRKQLSRLQRVLAWAETVIGLPIALWGVANHAAAGFLLYMFGLTKDVRQLRPGLWAVRALVVLGCYAGQVALVNHAMGRAAAGYYAVTLPISGIYLWRYTWLLRRRTRILLLGARARTFRRLAESRRRLVLARLEAVLAPSAKIAATPRP